MIVVSLVGRVSQRPFRPGNSGRVVLKIDCDDERGRSQPLEVDAFSENGDWVMKNVQIGETLAVSARLELRTYMDHGEEVDELRLVGVRFEPAVRRTPRRDNRLQTTNEHSSVESPAHPDPQTSSFEDEPDNGQDD